MLFKVKSNVKQRKPARWRSRDVGQRGTVVRLAIVDVRSGVSLPLYCGIASTARTETAARGSDGHVGRQPLIFHKDAQYFSLNS